MRLIIDTLSESESLTYVYTGAVTVFDPNLISLDFTIRIGAIRDEVNVRGLIDAPLKLTPQYKSGSPLENHPDIDNDLKTVSDKINRLL